MSKEDDLIRSMLSGQAAPVAQPMVLAQPINDMQTVFLGACLIQGANPELTEKEACHIATRTFAINMVHFQQKLPAHYVELYMNEMSIKTEGE